MRQLFFVFIGGGLGSALRYIIGRYLNHSESGFPLGTFAVNILGSLLIGIIIGLAAKNNMLSQNQTLLLATGFCGGFTTFSTFAYENHVLFKNGDLASFFLYSFGSFILAFIAVFVGLYLSRILS